MEEIRDWERKELEEMAYEHLLSLGWDAKTARHMARIRAPLVGPESAKAANKATAPKVEAVKVDKPEAPKRRGRRPGRQSADTLVSDRRLREAMLKAVNANGRVNRGLRRLAQDADMSEAAVRRALKAWEASGQLVREDRGRGKTQSIKLGLVS